MQQQGVSAGAIIKESYQLARKLGEGGMGEVWEAFNPRLPKMKYAIKFLFGHSTDSEQFERFQREAHILTRLEHENITRIHDLDFHYQPPFIVLEYLDGEPLSSRLARAKEYGQTGLPLSEVIHIIRQVGAALKATHSQGVIHRDLKPENIYLCHQSHSQIPLIKVLDFGVSKINGAQQITQHLQGFLGTPQYMSPEQALGYDTLDHRADQFALGIILYELLSGELPFKGEQIVQIATQIVHGDPPYIREHLPTLSDEAARALHRALCKSPDDRFASCEDFVNAFLKGASAAAIDDDWSADNKTEVGVRASIIQGRLMLTEEHSRQPAQESSDSWGDSETIQVRYKPEDFHQHHEHPQDSSQRNEEAPRLIQSADPSTFPATYPSQQSVDYRYEGSTRRHFPFVIMIVVTFALILGFCSSQTTSVSDYASDTLSDSSAPRHHISDDAKRDLLLINLISKPQLKSLKKHKQLSRGMKRTRRTVKVRGTSVSTHLILQLKRQSAQRAFNPDQLRVQWVKDQTREDNPKAWGFLKLPIRASKDYEVLQSRFKFTQRHIGRWAAVVTDGERVIAHLIFEVTS